MTELQPQLARLQIRAAGEIVIQATQQGGNIRLGPHDGLRVPIELFR